MSVSRIFYFILIVSIVFLLLVGLRLNHNQTKMNYYHLDQWGTVYPALEYLHNGKMNNSNSLESIRWIVRASYPYALIHLNKRMGGNAGVNPRSYPGHPYITKHYINLKPPGDRLDLRFPQPPDMNDPNLRDFFYALKIPGIVLIFLSFIPLFYLLVKNGYFLLPLFSTIYLGFSRPLIHSQSYLYIEPFLLASINIFLFYFIYSIKSYNYFKTPVYFGLLFAFTFSLKFSIVFLALLPLAIFVFHHKLAWPKLAETVTIFAGSFFLGLCLINYPTLTNFDNFNQLIQDFFFNFWAYSAGYNFSRVPGIDILKGLNHESSGLLALSVLAIVYIAIRGNKSEKLIGLIIFVPFLLTIYSLSTFQNYLSRNIVPFLGIISYVVFLAFEILVRDCNQVLNQNKYKLSFNVIIGLLLISSIWFIGIGTQIGGRIFNISSYSPKNVVTYLGNKHKYFLSQFSPQYVFLTQVNSALSLLGNSGVDGLMVNDLHLAMVDIPEQIQAHINGHANVDTTPVKWHSTPRNLKADTFLGYVESVKQQAETIDIVLVNRVGSNKQLTNYVLPTLYTNSIQVGDSFIFFNNSNSDICIHRAKRLLVPCEVGFNK